MASKPIVAVSDFGRLQNHGRIRTGVKSGRAMKAIPTFRFTSPDPEAIKALAARFGGTPKRWSDPKANPENQFEVITEASTIDVVLPPSGIDSGYELFSGRGILRRCDGEDVIVYGWDGETQTATTQPCICDRQGALECKMTTRVEVLFPWLPFRGTWRLDTKSWNAAHEMPAMMQILDHLRERQGLSEVELYIEQQTKIRNGRKSHFQIPRIRFKQSVTEMLEGGGVLAASLGSGGEPSTMYAIAAAPDDEPVEAELVDEE